MRTHALITPAAVLLVLAVSLARPVSVSAQEADAPAPVSTHEHPPLPPPSPARDASGSGAAGPSAPIRTHQHPSAPPEIPLFIPPITDEMRQAAFPDVEGHSVHDQSTNWFLLFDQMEWESGESDLNLGWDTKGWVGRDRTRFWFRTEGQRESGRLTDAQSHAFYGRQIARWWDVLVGVRQDFRPGPAQTWAAVGIQGLAPYWFDVEATAYLGASGRSHLRVETSYELLLTNRLILQPQAEMEIYGKDDPDHFRAAGLATLDTGIRLRYLIRREFAPYVGVVWHKKYFGTADLARANGDGVGGARLVLGARLWM